MGAREARFAAHGVAAGGLAIGVSVVVAAAGELVALLAGAGGWLAGFGLPGAALLAVVYGQARWARSLGDAADYRWFAAGAGLALAGLWGLLGYLLAAGVQVDAATWGALGGLPAVGAGLLWRAWPLPDGRGSEPRA